MTGWTLFFTVLGVAILTAQLFRLIDLIERPARHTRRAAVWLKVNTASSPLPSGNPSPTSALRGTKPP